jgi:Cu-Zn family superoxide dismutase
MRTLMMACVLIAACGEPSDDPEGMADTSAASAVSMAAPGATATLRDATGRELGTVTLTQADSGIQVTGRVDGLAPGTHGIHLHTIGSCSPTFAAAGAHWNPAAREHGAENPAGPHRGDLANLLVIPDSSSMIDLITPGGQLEGAEGLLDVDGASVVIHAIGDDYRTDPDGAAGERVVCGAVQ